MASFDLVTEGQGMQALSVDQSEQLPNSISTCDVNRNYDMLLLFLFLLFLFFCFVLLCFCLFFSFFQEVRHDFYKFSRV